MSRVGDNIKKLRTEAGMSLKQLAKKLGVAENFINEVENGRKVVNEEVINRISKILGKDINDIGMSVEEQSTLEVHQDVKPAPVKREVKSVKTEAVQEIWSSAFGSVLKEVPVYEYDMKKVITTRLLPLQGNKIEGYAQDKVFFLTIADDDMLGFRMAKGDIAFAHQVMEIENNAVYLLQYNSDRVIRQIKKLDGNKLLLISNKGSLRTETVTIKDIKIIAKLDRVEIKL